MLTIRENEFPAWVLQEIETFLPQVCAYDVFATQADVFSVYAKNGKARITYTKKHELFRALSMLKKDGSDVSITETPTVERISFLLDCSRGGVINETSFQKLVKTLACLGYNEIQLYTEDTYEVEGEPCFGHLRGRLTIEECKRYDDYADAYGIELVPCINTLAHMDNLFIWDEYEQIRDICCILLAEDERTYQLIDNMFASIAKAFRSHKINIGFDEPHFVGLGKYYKKHGITSQYDVTIKHLQRVLQIAQKYGFSCLMWTDFLINALVPQKNDKSVTKEQAKQFLQSLHDVTPCYWEYSHTRVSDYDKAMQRHKKLEKPFAFCAGTWKWLGFTPLNQYAYNRIIPGLKSALKNDVKYVMLTSWGDNGSECSMYAPLPLMVAFAETARTSTVDKEIFKQRMQQICKASFDDFMKLDWVNAYHNPRAKYLTNPAKVFTYNDPIYGMEDYHITEENCKWFAKGTRTLSNAKKRAGEYAYLFETQIALCKFLALKANMGNTLKSLYLQKDKQGLKNYANTHIPKTIKALDAFEQIYRVQWLKEWKIFGLNDIQLRLGGLRIRLSEAIRRIHEYVNGDVKNIPELEEPTIPYCYPWEKELIYKHTYEQIASSKYRPMG